MNKHKPVTAYPHILHGGDYNPDQWKNYPEILEEDIRLFKLAGINAVSLGIFAWATLEPEEGKYDFSFFDKVIDNLYKNGIYTILATPSGARPAWMAEKYPEVLRVTPDRHRILFSKRHNHCLTSPVYRQKVRAINTALAEHYKDNPAIIAWHVSNEYGGDCHCELCQEKFREWLKKKYNNDLDLLNEQWWSAFWSHTYTSWEQIQSPTNPSPIGETDVHALVLDWKRFTTAQTADFIKNETQPLRQYTPNIPITANFMQYYKELDYSKLKDCVDFISWDSYPEWHTSAQSNEMVACGTAFLHDSMRSYLHKPFLLMENTPSLTNWKPINKLKRPNMNKTSSLQAIAHGSDSVLYFQLRKSRGSSEKFHGAVIDHAGHENTRVFREVADLGACLKKLDRIVGSRTNSEVAVIYDVENFHGLNQAQGFQMHNTKYDETLIKHYYPFWKNGVCVDVIDSDYDFSAYKLLIMPMLYMIKPGVEERIERFVANGGTAVMTYASAMVNENDLCALGGFPSGRLKDVFGIWAEEIDTLYEDESNSVEYNGKKYTVKDYCEIVHPSSAQTLAVYENDFYKGCGALFKNNYKNGTAYYIAARDTGDLCVDFYEKLIGEIKPVRAPEMKAEQGVVCTMREDDECRYVFVQNYTDKHVCAEFSEKATDMETGAPVCGKIELDSFDSRILMFEK